MTTVETWRVRSLAGPWGLFFLVAAGCASDPATPLCGDGQLDPGELCDPAIAEGEPGACPASCDDGEAPTIDVRRGSADTCTAECLFVRIPACGAADGFCPPCCTAARDTDCAPSATCGDGVVDPGESCDLTCPASCDDALACTSDALEGSAATCDVTCSHQAIADCAGGDGCCPASCTRATDSDCPGAVGEPCATGDECAGGVCLDWPGGYCSESCTETADCASGSHCATVIDDGVGIQACVADCAGDDCRTDYECIDVDADQVSECAPPPAPNGAPNGAPCSLAVDCAGGICNSSWPGGYCSEECGPSESCTAGGHCVENGGLGYYCLADCSTTIPCRSSYACVDMDSDAVYECWITP